MSSAMLSRFDLVFLLLDRPDEALDHNLSEHVLALHSGEPAGLGASHLPCGLCNFWNISMSGTIPCRVGSPGCCDP